MEKNRKSSTKLSTATQTVVSFSALLQKKRKTELYWEGDSVNFKEGYGLGYSSEM